MDMQGLKNIISCSEEILMEKILKYAKNFGYAKYTSTLKEAWRQSISGLSEGLLKAIDRSCFIPEMGADVDYAHSEISEFGVREAHRHRSRGITLSMFLGFMKYYHQSYADLVAESNFSTEEKEYFLQYVKRYFDYVELGFTVEWSNLSSDEQLNKLQQANRNLTNEKNKYLTVFESIYDPIILVDQDNNLENINYRASEVFFQNSVSGMKYYGNLNTNPKFDWLKDELEQFARLNTGEVVKEKTLQTVNGEKTFTVKFKKMLDFSEKYRGFVIIFYDITDRLKIERELKQQHEKLEYFAFTDAMTGVSNRRIGLLALERELTALREKEAPLSVCFLDIDGLKEVNDLYGHQEGDRLITCIVSAIKWAIRQEDTVSRMGGDEFLLIFPDCSQFSAEKVIGRIQERVAAFDAEVQEPYSHAFSYGIMEVTGESSVSANDVIKEVDARMYVNKYSKKKDVTKSSY